MYDQMCFFILTELEQPLWTTGKHRFALPEEVRVPQIMEKTTAFEFGKAQAALLKLKGDRVFAAGDEFTMADVLLGQTVAWAQNFKFDVDESLQAYKDKVFAREACQKAKALIKQD
jgi:glutathione S-transferase